MRRGSDTDRFGATMTTEAPRRLPTGTVTFVFTDIEGSTRLVQALGAPAWAALLDRHRELVRAAITVAGGIEILTEGDSFFVVFPRAHDAVAAMAEVQRALAAEPWPPDAAIRVRIGIHTGEGFVDGEGDYIGTDVHRAARIEAAANGGQTLVSESTRALVASDLPPGVTIRDVGEHRLKDLRPERLAQLDIAGVPTDERPVRSLDSRPNNLPTQLTSFVGREREVAEATELLLANRLLTLSGPGGTGKTRLSLQVAADVADRFPDGVWWVPLEPIRDRSLVGPTIARTLGLADSTSRTSLELLIDHIGGRRILLVLDNFEQVVDAAPIAADLLRACPELRILVTSRTVLRVYGEQEYPVPGLPAPPDLRGMSRSDIANLPAEVRAPDPAALGRFEAVRLFLARAVAARPGFALTPENAPAVAQIVARLYGMPLAIELAAARVKLLSPDQILTRLEDQLALLSAGSRDLPERQQTLRGAVAWSYELLDEPSRRLLLRLSVFAGGWDLDAAESVCGPADELGLDVFEGLSSLTDQSLIRMVEAADAPRFVMLDTIRSYAAELLVASGEAEAIADRHMRTFAGLARSAASHLQGPDQRPWHDRLERDHDNLRKALDRAGTVPDPELAVAMAFDLWRFWQQRGYLNEGRARLEAIEARHWDLRPESRARLYEALGGVAYWQADEQATSRWYGAALEIRRELGDPRELANALYNEAYAIGVFVRSRDFTPEQRAHFEAGTGEALAIYRELGDRIGEANVQWGIGTFYYFARDPGEAEPRFRESLEIFRAEGQTTMEAWALHMLGTSVLKLGRSEEAAGIMRHALADFQRSGDLAGVTLVLDDLSAVAVVDGDLPRAARLRGAARQLQAATGTELATWVDEEFETATRPNARNSMAAEDLERFGAEGAVMPLDEAIAYALEGHADGDAAHDAAMAASRPARTTPGSDAG